MKRLTEKELMEILKKDDEITEISTQLQEKFLNERKNDINLIIETIEKNDRKLKQALSEAGGLSLSVPSHVRLSNFTSQTRAVIRKVYNYDLPVSIREILEKTEQEIINFFIHYKHIQPALSLMKFLENNYQNTEQEVNLFRETSKHLKKIKQKVESSDLYNWIKQISYLMMGRFGEHQIIINIIPIILYADNRNFSVQNVAIVVYLHELVHAYTFLGFDKDGHQWNDSPLYNGNKDSYIVEGLANAYSVLILKKLYPETENVIDDLIFNNSTEKYRDFVNRLNFNSPRIYENLRRAMIEFKHNPSMSYQSFLNIAL